jgi:hypothetical protein
MLPHPETILIYDSPNAEFAAGYNALLVYLDRKPTPEDLKLLSILPDKEEANRMDLFYNKIRLGSVLLHFEIGNPKPVKVSFTPFAILN